MEHIALFRHRIKSTREGRLRARVRVCEELLREAFHPQRQNAYLRMLPPPLLTV